MLWVVVGVVVIIVIIAIAALASESASNAVKVTGINWTIDYAGTTSGYFGASPQNGCGNSCPLSGTTGGQFTDTLTLTSTAVLFDHQITSITVDSPFTLDSTSPSLPISVSPGGTATVTLTITAPSSGGSYVMTGTITTS
jgi:hypothetical protein